MPGQVLSLCSSRYVEGWLAFLLVGFSGPDPAWSLTPSGTSRYVSYVLAWQHAWELPPMDSEIPPYLQAPKYDSIVSLQQWSQIW